MVVVVVVKDILQVDPAGTVSAGVAKEVTEAAEDILPVEVEMVKH